MLTHIESQIADIYRQLAALNAMPAPVRMPAMDANEDYTFPDGSMVRSSGERPGLWFVKTKQGVLLNIGKEVLYCTSPQLAALALAAIGQGPASMPVETVEKPAITEDAVREWLLKHDLNIRINETTSAKICLCHGGHVFVDVLRDGGEKVSANVELQGNDIEAWIGTDGDTEKKTFTLHPDNSITSDPPEAKAEQPAPSPPAIVEVLNAADKYVGMAGCSDLYNDLRIAVAAYRASLAAKPEAATAVELSEEERNTLYDAGYFESGIIRSARSAKGLIEKGLVSHEEAADDGYLILSITPAGRAALKAAEGK